MPVTSPARVGVCLCVLLTSTAAGQRASTVVECNTEVLLKATLQFDPPVEGPLTYAWREKTGPIFGDGPEIKRAFGIGPHLVTIVATAPGGRSATDSILVEARDTVPPVIQAARSLVRLPASAANVPVDVIEAAAATAVDECDASPRLTARSSGPFRIGDTVVRVTATDESQNSAFLDIVVRVPIPDDVPAPPVSRTRSVSAPPRPPASRDRAPVTPAEPPAPATEPAAPVVGVPEVVPGAPPGPAVPAVPSLPAAGLATAAATALPPAGAPGASWWWLLPIAAAALAIVGLMARVGRRRGEPPAPVIRARPIADNGVQDLAFPGGLARRSIDIRVRPLADNGEQAFYTDRSGVLGS